jgi:hypothetical protein
VWLPSAAEVITIPLEFDLVVGFKKPTLTLEKRIEVRNIDTGRTYAKFSNLIPRGRPKPPPDVDLKTCG